MTDSISILAEHVSRTLPDSISQRARILTALATVIRSGHPVHRAVSAQLAALKDVQRLQEQLPLEFENQPTTRKGSQ